MSVFSSACILENPWSLLVIMYHLLKDNLEYHELGADFFDRLEPARLRRYLVNRLEHLGYEVSLTAKSLDDQSA